MCQVDILRNKVFLTVDDVQKLNSCGKSLAYKIIQQIGDKTALKGQCSVDSYIRHFDLNPANYGRQPQ